MSGKQAKKIRKLAQELATENKSYLVKKSTKVFTDLTGNRLPYTTDQTTLHPMCSKSIVKFLNKSFDDKKIFNLPQGLVGDLLALESTAQLSELAADGYKLV